MLYRIVLEFKQKPIFDINSSPFYSVTIHKSMISELQMCQMDVGIRFWSKNWGLVNTHYYDSQFLRGPNAESLLKLLDLFYQSFGH